MHLALAGNDPDRDLLPILPAAIGLAALRPVPRCYGTGHDWRAGSRDGRLRSLHPRLLLFRFAAVCGYLLPCRDAG